MTSGTVNKIMNRQPGLQESFLNVYIKRHNPQSKKTTHRVRRQPTEWELIFANHIYDKEFMSKMNRKLLKLNNKKLNSKMGKELEQTFLQRYSNGQ